MCSIQLHLKRDLMYISLLTIYLFAWHKFNFNSPRRSSLIALCKPLETFPWNISIISSIESSRNESSCSLVRWKTQMSELNNKFHVFSHHFLPSFFALLKLVLSPRQELFASRLPLPFPSHHSLRPLFSLSSPNPPLSIYPEIPTRDGWERARGFYTLMLGCKLRFTKLSKAYRHDRVEVRLETKRGQSIKQVPVRNT